MDDDLLADDGQFKDDGLDDLDLDEEAALLGLSDEEIEDKRNLNDEDVEYFDEEGNPVEIGENNADQYEVANPPKTSSADEDVLDLNLDDELDNFLQDDADSGTVETSKTRSYDKQHKGNLISLTLRSESEKVQSFKRKESISSPNIEIETTSSNIAYVSKSLTSSQRLVVETNDDLEYDEESEDENMEDDHRDRFRSERSNIITLTPAKKRTDIPDTLDSVISQEETAKVQAFLENEQKRKMRFKGRPLPRMKSATYSRNPQPFMNKPQSQIPQFSTPQPEFTTAPPTSTQSRKILINPHFRGVLVPPTSGEAPMVCENTPAPHYEQQPPQNMMPPVYSHQEIQSPNSAAPPPIYSSPPSVQYQPPDYPPQQPYMQQAPPPHPSPVWQTQPPPDLPPTVPYSAPPPIMNYGSQPPPTYQSNYNSNNFQNTNFQAPPPPIPQSVTYNQPPPPFHMQPPPAYTSPPSQTNISHPGYHNSQPSQDSYHQMKVPQSAAPHYQRNTFPQNQQTQPQNQNPPHQNRPLQQNQRSMQQNLRPLQQNQQMHNSNQFQRKQNQQQNQRFPRLGEKRPLNTNIKEVPMKLARSDSTPVRKNTRMVNSNIKEIPLVDTMSSRQPTKAVVEEEDEQTKELRIKIEEQKRLREQILKQKEARRRQMAAQRLIDLKKRQAEQNTIVIPLTQSKFESSIPVKKQPVVQQKLSVKERIGMPPTNVAPVSKKKIVVLRKKPVPPPTMNATAPKKPVLSGQKTENENASIQNKEISNNQPVNTLPKQNTPVNSTPTNAPKKKIISLKKVTQAVQQETTVPAPSNVIQQKNVSGSEKSNTKPSQKPPVQARLGNRPGFQKKDFKSIPFQQGPGPNPPRFRGPRGPQFPPSTPFMDQRMRGPAPGPPMNEMRMPLSPPHSFHEPRPPLLAFRPPGERPHLNQFGFESNRPPFHPGDLNRPRFHPRGPGDMNHPDFHGPHPGEHHQFRPPGPYDHQFHPGHGPERPGFQNFRPRGMDMFPPDRFPPPHFHNQMNQPRQFFEPNNQMPQRPPFHQNSNRKQRFPRPNVNQQKQTPARLETKTESKPVETQKSADLSTKSPVTDTNANQANYKFEPKEVNFSSDTVSVENLSSSTNVGQLKKLCSSVGVVEDIKLMKDERKAIIKFKQAQQALNFQKKYQRYMLDLAMIQVSLLP